MAVDDHEMSSTTEAEYKPFPDPLMGTGADVTPASDGGVLKAVRKEGDITEADRPMKGDKVFVHYVGTLTDGTLFDSSRSRNEQFSFTLGEGQVIKAWDLGVATMRRGEIAVLTCKPEYAYGQRSQGKIPAGATLVFEVELFDWKGEDLTDDKDGGVVRRVITAGDGKDTPNEEAKVDVHITGCLEGKEFENRDVEFIITEGKDAGVVAGVELALQRMEKGETASIKVGPKYAYGSEGRPEFNIPGDANLTYEVTLKNFEKAKEPWEMDIEEKLAQSETIKAKGTNYFKQGRFEDALKQWRKIVTYLETETSVEGDNKQKSEAIQLAANLNIAMAALKIKDAVEALSKCDRALELDATNVKAFFRKGQALFHMSDYEQARACFAKVLELEPENKAARNQLSLSNQKIKQHLQKEKRIYGNMFARFAEQDKREKEARERARGDLEVGVFNNGEKKKEGGDGREGGGAAPGGEEQMEGAEKTAETEDGEKEQLKSEEKQEVEPMQV